MTLTTENSTEEKQKQPVSVAFRAYTIEKESATCDLENERILKFLPMVNKIARQVVSYLKPPLSFEDMVSAGTVGLVRAARDFDSSRGVEFKTYAYIRIKGAILDELRGWSFVPANLHNQIKEAQRISREIMEQTGSAPSDEKLAEKLGMSLEDLYQMLEKGRAQHFVSLDSSSDESPALGSELVANQAIAPDEQIERQELISILAKAIQQLPEKPRRIILLYYNQNLTMKQIAEVLEITEPRVSQLHASALFNLSVKLRQYNDG
ncbi:MAG: FliA/WhiG family RNA polymerase sigma factor [Sedimentisphaerales bacterium]|nr:FliA/WhiG family RNA polymerase sigma factor [Sedimentisphaerales bacterium]